MHLIAATPGAISDGTDPVDPGQTPADVVILSAADTELAQLAEARASMETPPGLRLTNLAHLRHPMSVDMHLDACATRSRLVVARILGGAGYWRYGVEQFAARLHEAGVPFAALPGDDKPDEELRRLSTVSDADYDALWSYFVEGGPENATHLLAHARTMLDGGDAPPPARPLLRAGLYWPGAGQTDMAALRDMWTPGAPVVPVVFYRALLQGAGLHPVNLLTRSLLRAGLNPMPVFVASLKDPLSAATLEQLFTQAPPDVIVNLTSFATGTPDGPHAQGNPLAGPAANRAPVLQAIMSGSTEETWEGGKAGLTGRDIAMNVALPEVDGRIVTRAIAFKGEAYFDEATQCPVATWRARGDRIDWVSRLAGAWARLRATPAADRRVALILANYPNRDGRLANGVGLDTPATTVGALHALAGAGYGVTDVPRDADALMRRLMDGPTNWLTDRADREGGELLPMEVYRAHYGELPWELRLQVEDRWGAPEADPFVTDEGFRLSIHRFGQAVVGLQPARGYNIDPTETYHSPDLVPPHNYIAFYIWLRDHWGAQALVHMGKHGNLEWLPGKGVALSATCFPEAVLGPLPHVYPFIVNDPGEGTQAKRRAAAVIVDHLTPPLTRAESHGAMAELEALCDEYYEAAGVDPRRTRHLKDEILSLARTSGLDADIGLSGADAEGDLARLDAYLCELKEAQIRDGLHVFGQAPEGRLARDLALALLRAPRGREAAEVSLLRALAQDFGLKFDPLDTDMAARWTGPRPEALVAVSEAPWRSAGDTIERLELFAADLVAPLIADTEPPSRGEGRDSRTSAGPGAAPGPASAAVMDTAAPAIAQAIAACGPAEMTGLMDALDGRAIPPGPSGAPSRGRPDVLPTGRNFYSVDSRAVPTPAAWALGWRSASLLVEKHLQTEGDWPRALVLTAWGTANMRTGGDDIAQGLALMGVKPTWDAQSRRVTGFEVLPAGVLGRPRVDVTFRISGFFRDAFPAQIALLDSAARAVQALDEPADQNPAAARARAEGGAGARVFGSKPGAYGAGLQAMIDERLWTARADLGEAWLDWGGYAYGADAQGVRDRAGLEARVRDAEAVVQNQDNREHDLLDSDDYYQFEGGAAAAIEALQGRTRPVWHNDHSRPERPVIRSLDDEIGRVVRSRVVNPKWIAGVKRHGYKGAFEIAATVDYLFAFAATTGAVKNHHFDMVEAAFLADDDTRAFIAEANPPALAEIAERLGEAIDRGLWSPRSNTAADRIARLKMKQS
ncbi:cobaltochelatase subunit CobN [Mesobaculum littorinae]|uniref:Cobaltochelatase subunit CobN n=1 Tax=Mesobaculum littorinae TaxID=2486419 RepID=A0A438AGI9_9RHOB|nr:cobaltochelatase subunit CobN [Mesobaculum littorinae]RVV97808.1 cobaltochelatase subunit CobN [Mesobaculum littorinae]